MLRDTCLNFVYYTTHTTTLTLLHVCRLLSDLWASIDTTCDFDYCQVYGLVLTHASLTKTWTPRLC